MKAYSYRFLILAAFCCCLPSVSKAQEIRKPVENIAADSVKQTQPQPAKTVLSPLEIAVAVEINQARSNPQKFIAILEDYRKYMTGNVLALPNKVKLQMIEGLPAIDDAISDLKKMTKFDSLEVSGGLSKVARRHLTDLQENPKLKHYGKDGSDLEKRLQQVGFAGNAVAENISYRVDTALEVVLNMIIDDGIKSRSHRKNIFSPTFKLFGIACGAAKDKTTLCVAEFADTFKEFKS